MSAKAPLDGYYCSQCNSRGVKLWRRCGIGVPLLCGSCALLDQELPGPIDEDGRTPGMFGPTDQIGSWIPAVPTGSTFWGYTSVPPEDVAWWRALPLKK